MASDGALWKPLQPTALAWPLSIKIRTPAINWQNVWEITCCSCPATSLRKRRSLLLPSTPSSISDRSIAWSTTPVFPARVFSLAADLKTSPMCCRSALPRPTCWQNCFGTALRLRLPSSISLPPGRSCPRPIPRAIQRLRAA